jgi:hypothetical protein
MLMSPSHSDVGVSIHSIIRTQSRYTFKDTISDSGIPTLRVQNHIYNTVAEIVWIPNNEGTRVDPLAESRSDLTQACIALYEISASFIIQKWQSLARSK